MELEAGAVLWAIIRLRKYLIQLPFEVYADPKALKNLSKVGESNARVQRWLEILTAYRFKLFTGVAALMAPRSSYHACHNDHLRKTTVRPIA